LFVFKSDLESLPEYGLDDTLAAKVENALWSIDILQNTDYMEMNTSVQDGIVKLRGHVISMMDKTQIGDAVRSIAGVLGVENSLVVDQDLVIEVTQALGKDEHTRHEWITVGAQNGVITLRGQVGSAAIRGAAGEITANTSQVRGVINDLQAPDVVIDPEEHRFRQPLIDQDVYAADMELGQVMRVIISPRSRRETAFVVDGTFPDPLNKHGHRLPGEDSRKKRRVVIPISALRDITYNSVLLEVSGVEAAQNRDFNPVDFISPPASWKPPYPYHWEEVLFDK
jgi:osmotically-inducible protein OsmY